MKLQKDLKKKKEMLTKKAIGKRFQSQYNIKTSKSTFLKNSVKIGNNINKILPLVKKCQDKVSNKRKR